MTKTASKITFAILLIATLITAYNWFQLGSIRPVQATGADTAITATGAAVSDIVPTGTSAIYGQELQVAYDDVSPNNPKLADQTIRKLGQLDQSIELEGADLERYINILYKQENGISCEYCCGARSVIFENGQAACGCAHSYAMRGLAKYLITEHGDEYTDAEILEEVGKWKTLFFPAQITAKAQILESQGIELNYINLASNKYRGIEKGSSGSGMVGGC